MTKVQVDPRIKIQTVADGEVHIIFNQTKDDLAQLAIAFIAVSDGKMDEKDVKILFRLRNKEGVDYLIRELQKARVKLFGKGQS